MTTENARTDDRLLRVKEAARYLGYSPARIYELVADNAIPFEKLPTGGLRFRLSALDAWVTGQPAAKASA